MRTLLTLSLVVAGVVLRVIPHPWNFAPIGAIALFGGARFDKKWMGITLPLITMLIGDAYIGFHSAMPVIYATYALIAVIGMFLHDRRSIAAIGGASLLSSTIFYVTTNFDVWARGTAYAKNAAGLATCYIAAIPFFERTIASDLLFSAIFFGVFAAVERASPAFARA